MNRRIATFAALFLALAALSGAAPAGSGASTGRRPAPAAAAGYRNVTLHVFSRVFATFHDKVVALPRREFRVGDTEYTARVLRFVPDFTMDLKTKKVVSRTNQPNNPAFEIQVSRKGVPHDTTWAFFNMPPHFSARAQLAFVATRIEFPDRPALESRDSLAIKLRAREGSGR